MSNGYGRRIVTGFAISAAAAAAGAMFSGAGAFAAPAEGAVRGADAPGAISDQYIVVFKDVSAASADVSGNAERMARKHGGAVKESYQTAVRGFSAKLSAKAARELAADPSVAFVEQDRKVTMSATQNSPTWGLDRIDQTSLPLSGTYAYGSASTVTAYVLDTGVRLSHSEFGGRASSGYDFIDKDSDASDCQGHGTHVAGTVAGKTYGVAKDAKIVSVRVLDCQGSGSYSAIIGGVDWVTKNAKKPAVANMSLGGSTSSALDNAVKSSIASGVTYALAAGNESTDACSKSPARTPEAITVGSTDKADKRSSFSNYGKCVDIFAPGSQILSSAKSGDGSTTTMSGTSMASPHVAGAVALYLAANPTATPAQVRDALVGKATTGKVTSIGTGSPNVLLNTTALGTAGPVTPPATEPAPSTPSTPSTPANCTTQTNGTDVAIADRATVTSELNFAGCTGRASKAAKVAVNVKHTDRGDLAVYLIAPDGTEYKLKSSTSADNVSNYTGNVTVNLSAENKAGVWKLKVRDIFSGDRGTLDSWTLTI